MDREVLEHLVRASCRDRRLVFIAALILGLVLIGIGTVGPMLAPASRREFQAAAVVLGSIWFLLSGFAMVSSSIRIRRLKRDLDVGSGRSLRTRMRRCWEIGDIEDGPRATQWVRCERIRGPLLVPLGTHRVIQGPRNVTVRFAPISRVVLAIDDRPLWTRASLEAVDRIEG